MGCLRGQRRGRPRPHQNPSDPVRRGSESSHAPGQQNPDPSQIDSAAQQALNITGGDNSTFHIVAPNAKADRGSTANANVNESATTTPQPWWHRTTVIWGAVAALAAVAGVIATVVVK